jgi:hypothetical protein
MNQTEMVEAVTKMQTYVALAEEEIATRKKECQSVSAGRVVYVATITGVSRAKTTGDRGNIVPPPIVEASVPVQVG